MTDERQAPFSAFSVPDAGRIRKVHRWLQRQGFLDTAPGPVVALEIGYARGGLVDLLDSARGYEITAVDLHDRDVPAGVTFVRHNCNEQLAFLNDSSTDVVFAGEVIEHVVDDGGFLAEIRRILRPGGVVALTTPNLFFLANRFLMPLGHMPIFAYAPYHYHFYSRKTLVELVENSGLEVRHVTSSHLLVSTRRHPVAGAICERLGDLLPSLGAHLILFATKPHSTGSP